MSEAEKSADAKPAEADAPPAVVASAADAPPHPAAAQLRVAVDHFMAGNFAAARREVGALLQGEVPPEIKKQAEELVRRLGLDPVAVWVAIGSTLLFIIVVFLTYRH